MSSSSSCARTRAPPRQACEPGSIAAPHAPSSSTSPSPSCSESAASSGGRTVDRCASPAVRPLGSSSRSAPVRRAVVAVRHRHGTTRTSHRPLASAPWRRHRRRPGGAACGRCWRCGEPRGATAEHSSSVADSCHARGRQLFSDRCFPALRAACCVRAHPYLSIGPGRPRRAAATAQGARACGCGCVRVRVQVRALPPVRVFRARFSPRTRAGRRQGRRRRAWRTRRSSWSDGRTPADAQRSCGPMYGVPDCACERAPAPLVPDCRGASSPLGRSRAASSCSSSSCPLPGGRACR